MTNIFFVRSRGPKGEVFNSENFKTRLEAEIEFLKLVTNSPDDTHQIVEGTDL